MRWDRNWDLREPGEDERRRGIFPTATRHLLLIRCSVVYSFPKMHFCAIYSTYTFRHGQYNLQGTNDKERSLTDLGKQQAAVTAARSLTEIHHGTNPGSPHKSYFFQSSLQAGNAFSSLLPHYSLKHDKVIDNQLVMLEQKKMY